MGGAGIKSFTWSLDGVQPAEVDNVISATLTLHFQSVYDLFSLNKIPGTDDDYQAGLQIPSQAETPGYLDLIIGSGTTVTQKDREESAEESPDAKPDPFASPCGIGSEKYDGAYYRIKAIVGWATPPNFTQLHIPGYNTSQLEAIEKAITSSRKALYLQIVSHAINFEQNGTLELAIEYQASLSGLTRSPDADIFIAKEIHSGDIQALERELEEHEYEGAGPTRKSREVQIRDPVNGRTGELDEFLEKKKEINEKIIALMKKSRLHKYSVFLDMLADKNKVYGIRVPSDRLLQPIRDLTPEERAAQAKIRQGENVTPDALPGNQESDQELITLIEAKAASEKPAPDQTQDDALKAMAENVGIFNVGNEDTTLIPFFYLGDLIDVLFEERLAHMVAKTGTSKAAPLQMLLGTVELVDPLVAYQIQSVNFDCGDNQSGTKALADLDPLRFRKVTGITQFMNIGSIPISLDKFNEWFMNSVITPKKDSYFLLNFIKDVCSGLISSAYSSSCFENLFQFNIRFDTATFRMAESFAGRGGITIDDLCQSSRRAQRRDRLQLKKGSQNGPSTPTIMVYSVDSRPNVGDRAHDMQEGIYHYFLGGKCGLAKTINFNRQDMPFYREARISKDGSLGAQQLKELYTIDMDMIGNGLHKNGTFVYVDPIAIGAGSARAVGGIPNIARLIGLGGYFLVTKVNHEVSTAGYSTKVGAMQQMSAFDMTLNEKITSVDYYSGEANAGEADPSGNPDEDHYMAELEAGQSLPQEAPADGAAPYDTASPTGDTTGTVTGDAGSADPLADMNATLTNEDALDAAAAAFDARAAQEAADPEAGDVDTLQTGSGRDLLAELQDQGYTQSQIDSFAAAMSGVIAAQQEAGIGAFDLDQALAAAAAQLTPPPEL